MSEEMNNIAQEQVVEASATPAEVKGAKTSKKKVKKGVAVRQVATGRAYVKSTYNNTIVTFTDQNGNVLSWSSAGQCGFKGPKKATPYAAAIIVKSASEKVKKYGLKEVSVFVRGVGGGREAAVRALNANGLIVSNIKDITPIPHNGCRAPRPRRV
jgi:small subunit ribosomal protein S11